jgi:hypothetical protein
MTFTCLRCMAKLNVNQRNFQRHSQDRGKGTSQCSLGCLDDKRRVKQFSPSAMAAHTATKPHRNRQASFDDASLGFGLVQTEANRGGFSSDRSGLSRTGYDLQAGLICGVSLRANTSFLDFRKTLQELDPSIATVLRFGLSTSGLTSSLSTEMGHLYKEIKQTRIIPKASFERPHIHVIVRLKGNCGVSMGGEGVISELAGFEVGGYETVWLDVKTANERCAAAKQLELLVSDPPPSVGPIRVVTALVLEVVVWETLMTLPKGFARQLAAICNQHGVFTIADETLTAPAVMTNTWFAYKHLTSGFEPDFVLVGKVFGFAALLVRLHDNGPAAWMLKGKNLTRTEEVFHGVTTLGMFADPLERSTRWLKALIASDRRALAQRLTKNIPNLCREKGISTPPIGGGSLWYFPKGAMLPAGLQRAQDAGGRIRLPMDSDVKDVSRLMDMWIAKANNKNSPKNNKDPNRQPATTPLPKTMKVLAQEQAQASTSTSGAKRKRAV